MEAILTDGKEFTSLIGVVSLFDTTFNVKCTADGLKVFCLSSTKTSIAEFVLPPSYFESYNYTAQQPCIELGVNTTVLLQILKGTTAKDKLQLLVNSQSHPDTLIVGIQRTDRHIAYTIKLMSITEDDNLEIPDMEPSVRIDLKSDVLKAFKKEIIDYTGSGMSIAPTRNSLVIQSTGNDGSVNMTVPESEKMQVVVFNDPLPVTLGGHCITIASKLADLSTDVILGWTNGTPAHFQVPLGHSGSLDIWFAPLLDDTDME